ncbi:hypothetical protein EOM81_10475, partial [bacterium]|nr:hypothetical protein [bacterium]
DLRVGTDKRFFGYYSSYTKDGTLSPVKSFATATKGKTRLFADQLLSMYDAVWQRFYDNYFRINNADAHESLVQFDQAGNGERKIREFSAVSISGWESLFPYLYSTGSKTVTIESFTVLSVPKGIDANVFKSYCWIEPGLGGVLEFRLPINSYGNVKVDLMFCESHFSASDKRLFDISIEGKTVETNLDIYREAGGKNIALLRTYDTEVFDGVLNVKFTNLSPTFDNAMISGIRVTYTDKNTPDLCYYCGSATDGPYTDTYGFSWNKLAIPTNAKVTDHPLTSSEITSVPDGTTEEIFTSPYLLTGSANDFTCSIPFTGSNKADITIYYIEHYHTLDTLAGKRKFNVYIEGEKRENELNVFKESGGAKKGLARRYTGINVTGGSIDIKFEKGAADVPLFCGVSVSYIGSSQKLQNGGIFTQTDLSKLNGSVTTTGSGYAAITNMDNGWNKIASESVTPFRFEPVYMGKEEIYPATNYLYRKMLFGRDVASPTLFLFSNRRVTSPTAGKALEIRRVPLNGSTEKKDYSGLVMTDVAISEDGQNIFVSAAKDLRKINVAASLGDRERIATFSSPVTHLANKPFVRYKSTPASGTITDLGTVFTEARWGSNNAVIASGGIYIAGGTDSSGNALNKIYQYDVFANNLTWVATLSESLSKHSMAAYDDSLYLFNGARDIASFSESVTKYCVTTRTNLDSNKGYEEAIFDSAEVTIVSPRGLTSSVDDDKIGFAYYDSEPDGNNKVVSWNNGKEKTNKVPNAFDEDDSSEWKLAKYDSSSGRRYVQVAYNNAVCVNKFRIYTKDKNVVSCDLLASDDSLSWENLISVDLNKKDSYVDVANTIAYKYYRLNLWTDSSLIGGNKESKIKEITFYATDVITNTKTVPDTGMH